MATIVVAGSNSRDLAKNLSRSLQLPYVEAVTRRFPDGETHVEIPATPEGENVLIVQTIRKPVNDSLVELLWLVDATRRRECRYIIAVVPYLGYSRQDKLSSPSSSLAAPLVVNLLAAAGVHEIITLDLHSSHCADHFPIPVRSVSPSPFFVSNLTNISNSVVVSPDLGSIERAGELAAMLNCPKAVISKTRNNGGKHLMQLIEGHVAGRHCIVIDDIVDTGETVLQTVQLLQQHRAKSIEIAVTHAVLSGASEQQLELDPWITQIITTNSIPHASLSTKFKILDTVPMLESAIRLSLDSIHPW